MKYVQFSEIGKRSNNEDCCSIVDIPGKRTLFVVCDGMGGHFGGEIASRTVCDVFSAYWQKHVEVEDSPEKIEGATAAASEAIDRESGRNQMGTTLVMASVEGRKAHIAHAGDSRCYIIDIKGNVKYRTIDHEDRGYITNSFFTGMSQDTHPEVKVVELEPLDRILLCSDGLYKAVDDEALLHTLHCARDVQQVMEKYIAICRQAASDNYSAIIIEME